MVKIRLRRFGKKNTPVYRVVVADKRSPRDGSIIEEIGTYDPLLKRNNFTLKLDRVDYWLGVGAQPSDTVASFIRKARKGPVEEVDEEPVVEAVEAPAAPEPVPEPEVAVTEEPAAEEPTTEEPAAEETPAPQAEVAAEASAPEETPEPQAPTADEAEAPKADD